MNEDKFIRKERRGFASMFVSPTIGQSVWDYLSIVGVISEELEKLGVEFVTSIDTSRVIFSEPLHELGDDEEERSLRFLRTIVMILERYDSPEEVYRNLTAFPAEGPMIKVRELRSDVE